MIALVMLVLPGCSSLPVKMYSTSSISVSSPTSAIYTVELPDGGKLTSAARPDFTPVVTTSKKRYEISLWKQDPKAELKVRVELSSGKDFEIELEPDMPEVIISVDKDKVSWGQRDTAVN